MYLVDIHDAYQKVDAGMVAKNHLTMNWAKQVLEKRLNHLFQSFELEEHSCV